MSELPICVVLGAGGKNPDVIIKGILGEDFSENASLAIDGLTFHKWNIINKYYDATVNLCKMTEKLLLSTSMAENMNAAIIYFNSSNEEKGLEEATEWLPFISTLDIETKILVCDQCASEENCGAVTRIKAQQWCIKNGFELVELDPSEPPDPDDDFPETVGMQRIIQALHAHSWPNLELKTGADKSHVDHLSRLLLKETSGACKDDDPSLDRQASEGVDSFEELFQSMSLMKSQVSSLQGDERKAYAEKITMAFWKAIEGDAAEIEGLDSSADED